MQKITIIVIVNPAKKPTKPNSILSMVFIQKGVAFIDFTPIGLKGAML